MRCEALLKKKIKYCYFDRVICMDDLGIVTGLLYLRGSSGDHRLHWYGCNSRARKACVTRYVRIYIVSYRWTKSWTMAESIFSRLTCYTHRHGACTDFNQVIHCVKTKLDNFIAMALARSTSIIFHYVTFPSFPSSRRPVFSVIDRLGACTKHSRKLCLAASQSFEQYESMFRASIARGSLQPSYGANRFARIPHQICLQKKYTREI